MGRVIKYLIYLAILGGLVVVGNAIFFDLEPDVKEITVPIETLRE